MKTLAQFDLPYYQYLNETSLIVDDLPPFAQDTNTLIHLYRLMVFIRIFDNKAIALQRTGKLGTYPSTRGQEAVFVGMGHPMLKNDLYVPYYRDIGAMIQRGVKLSEILLYWGGDERGNVFESGCQDFPYSVPVGSQPLHAVGAAYAMKYRREKNAVLTACGDGATSEGDFYEALNAAGAWHLPVVFVVCNNQWAISVPRQVQTASQTLAQKAIAAGIRGEQVDGNDVIAVRHRVAEALEKARENAEPCLMEMVCYRQSDHTTADDASRYEQPERREAEWKKEPITRLRNYLTSLNAWNEEQETALQQECAQKVDENVQAYLNTPPQPLSSMFDYLYETLPEAYEDQRRVMIEQEMDHA